MKERYSAMDGLRAFSAIGIVIMHVLANGGYEINSYITSKIIPSFADLVFLFMIISGFSMCCGYYDRIINNTVSLDEFYGRRYKKVLPFFALLCIMDFVLSPGLAALCEVFANLTLCFGLIPGANISVIGVGWFLGVVFVFYFIFPFFVYLLSDRKRAWMAFFAAVVLNILCEGYFDVSRSSFIYCAMFFMAGGIIYLYRQPLKGLADKYGAILLLVIAAVICLYYKMDLPLQLLIVIFSLMTVYAMGTDRKILHNPVTAFISKISMEIYLCHMVIYRIIEKLHLLRMFDSELLSYIAVSFMTAAGAIIFSLIAKKCLEKAAETVRKRKDMTIGEKA